MALRDASIQAHASDIVAKAKAKDMRNIEISVREEMTVHQDMISDLCMLFDVRATLSFDMHRKNKVTTTEEGVYAIRMRSTDLVECLALFAKAVKREYFGCTYNRYKWVAKVMY